jgi:hypothetical protein
MFRIVRRGISAFAAATVIGSLLTTPAFAAGADVQHYRGSADGTSHDFNICGWPSVFVAHGQWHVTVMSSGADRIHVIYQESVRYEVTIDDDVSIPIAARGLVWQGINVFAFESDFDPTTAQEQTRSVQNFFEGPFRGLSERVTLRVAADGTILVDKTVSPSDVDCSAFGV